MAEKTFVDKAGETVWDRNGDGVRCSRRHQTAIDVAVTTVTEVLKTAPTQKASGKKAAKKSVTRRLLPKRYLRRRLLKKTEPRRPRLEKLRRNP